MGFYYKDIIPNFHYRGTCDRSFDEYLDMFNLSEDDLARDITSGAYQ